MKNVKTSFLLGNIIIGGVVAVLATASFLVIPIITTNYIIAYIFLLFGIAFFVLSSFLLTGRFVKIPQNLPFIKTAWIYLIVNLIVSILGILFSERILPLWFGVIQGIILCWVIIYCVVLFVGREQLNATENKIKQKVVNWQVIVGDLEMIKNKFQNLPAPVKDSSKKRLEFLYESMRFADPMSYSNEQESDSKIMGLLIQLSKAVDEGNPTLISENIDRLQLLVNERNSHLKRMK